MKRHLTCAIVVVAALGMFGGCGDDETEFPTGTFVPVTATSTEEGYIEYKSDGTYVVRDEFGNTADGTYTTDGDEITFDDDSFCETVAPDSNPVTYTFEWDGEVLSFGDNPDDGCDARVATLAIDSKLAQD